MQTRDNNVVLLYWFELSINSGFVHLSVTCLRRALSLLMLWNVYIVADWIRTNFGDCERLFKLKHWILEYYPYVGKEIYSGLYLFTQTERDIQLQYRWIWGHPNANTQAHTCTLHTYGHIFMYTHRDTVPSESIHTPWIFPHFVMLQHEIY